MAAKCLHGLLCVSTLFRKWAVRRDRVGKLLESLPREVRQDHVRAAFRNGMKRYDRIADCHFGFGEARDDSTAPLIGALV